MLVAISGGAGFLGLHLARRLRVRALACARSTWRRWTTPRLEGTVEELRGDVRDAARVPASSSPARTCSSMRPRRCRSRRRATRSSPSTSAAPPPCSRQRARPASGASCSSRRRRCTASPSAIRSGRTTRWSASAGTASRRSRPRSCAGSSAAAGSSSVIIRPKTFVGPERLGVFEILFDWVREGRRIYTLGTGANRYQLLAVEDLVDAVVRAFRPRARRARRSTSAPATSGPCATTSARSSAMPGRRPAHAGARPARRARARALERLRLSPLAEWHYKTAHRDSFVSTEKAQRLLGWSPRLSNAETPDRRPTTGTSPTGAVSARRARPTACRGTNRRSGC